jgi:hypothetical protein
MIVYSIKITLLLWGPTKKGRAIALAFVYDYFNRNSFKPLREKKGTKI